ISLDFMPSVMLTDRLFGMSFAFGSSIAIRSEVLTEIGGFRPFANELADDYLMGNKTRKTGRRVVLASYMVDSVLGRESFGDMWSRRLRWARTTRAMQPLPVFASGITHGIPLSCALLVDTGFGPIGWAAVSATLAFRWLTGGILAGLVFTDR